MDGAGVKSAVLPSFHTEETREVPTPAQAPQPALPASESAMSYIPAVAWRWQ
jgi:hypothetical protein